ncbi:MAG: SOS response-associated peptidase [Burkholderiales bacterium]|nr:MAG: SOS response-associated peptidase [Burkholderiales bacterium]
MCGRILQVSTPEEMAAHFGCAPPLPNAEQRYNGSPSQPFMVIRFNPETRDRRLDMLEWGLLPSWEKDPKSAYKRINAKAETVDTLPSFRAAFKDRRCLVPVDAFYEWKGDKPGHKQPHALARRDHKPFAVAGLWENWKDPSTEAWRRTFCVITCPANSMVGLIHDRMPVILHEAQYAAWLGETLATPVDLKAMLKPYPSGLMTMWPVDRKMSNSRYQESDAADPIGGEEFVDD